MMANILRRVIYVFLCAAILWVFFWWLAYPVIATVGGLCLLFAFVPVLGFQFLTIWAVNQGDPSPKATPLQHAKAWWAEVILTIKVFVVQQAYREHQCSDIISGPDLRASAPEAVLKTAQATPLEDPQGGFAKKQRGVLFIHGFLCNRGFWNPWLQRLSGDKIPFIAISLAPVFTSIDNYTLQIEQAVKQLAAATGASPLLICHSMGGLAARAWLRADPNNILRVSHIVTIGTPHHGTGIVQGPSFAENATQMQKNSAWITALAADERAHVNTSNQLRAAQMLAESPPHAANPYANFTCYYSNCDNIVFPARTATLDGADNRFVPGQAHVQMAFDETVMRESLAKL